MLHISLLLHQLLSPPISFLAYMQMADIPVVGVGLMCNLLLSLFGYVACMRVDKPPLQCEVHCL